MNTGTIIANLFPTVLLLLGGAVGWWIKSRTEELRALEAHLRDDRRRIYQELLEPYILLFAALGLEKNQSKAVTKLTSEDYKKTSFELVLVGSDEVVQAFNRLMRHSFEADRTGVRRPDEMLRLFGALLLEIRRSVGNKKTSLDEWAMIKWMIKDLDELRKGVVD